MKTILHNGIISSNRAAVLRLPKDDVISVLGTNESSSRPSESSSLADCIASFLDSLRANRVAENTIRAYDSDINRLIMFMHQRGHNHFEDIQSSDITTFIQQLSVAESSAATIRRTRAALKKFFRFLFENGSIASDPFEGATLEQTLSDRLNLSTILNIVVYCRRHYEAESRGEALRYRRDELIILVMIIYGIRQYHIPQLKLSAMKKEGDAVLLILSEELSLRFEGIVLHKLHFYLQSRDSKAEAIFIEDTGKPVSARSLHAMMIELSYAVRAQVNPQTLHHTFLHLQRNRADAAQLLSALSKLEEEAWR